ncbi:hypothetical protein OROHE_025832 [Orobanche hederae]
MLRASSNSINPRRFTGVRIVVAGDNGIGKSSLIRSAVYNKFDVNIASSVLPPQRLPISLYPDIVPVTIIDTSYRRSEDNDRVTEELQRADLVILTYACDRLETLENLVTFWLPHLRQLEVKQCSASRHIQVLEVFFFAQKAALYPTAPLFDQESQTLKPRCMRALKRIFILCDYDKDGALSDSELNNFQVKCFNAPFEPYEIFGVKRVVQKHLPEGVNERGLTLPGFLYLHALLIEKGPRETTWIVLRKFGYTDDIKLADDLIPPLKRAPEQSSELTNEAINFLETVFDEFDSDRDGTLQPRELEELFSTAPESPWIENPYKDAVERNAFGGLLLDAFLSEWALMTLLNPRFTMENLVYIGYPRDPSSAIHVTRRRHVDRKKQHSKRNVLQCFIFGPMEAGKSALLNSLIGRLYSVGYNPTCEDRYGVKVVDMFRGNQKYLVLREISEAGVEKLLANKESLASCDIAVFVHDRSDESSWKASSELLLKIAGHGEDTGFLVPCLIVAAKNDQDSFTMAIHEATRVSLDMGVKAPMPISVKFEDFNSTFRRIVTAAEHPHLSIPETELGKSRKQFRRLIDRSCMFVSVVLAAAVAVGVGAARKNASGYKDKKGEKKILISSQIYP